MFQEMTFEEWAVLVRQQFIKKGLALPEEQELLILAHMECMAEEKSIEKFVEEAAAEQKGNPG
ncbi:MAG: hypothetical protein V9F01_18560 [Chitinophagaceae bacterium]